jgi:hypothetical protein
MDSPFYRVEQTFDSQLEGDLPLSSHQPTRRWGMADAGLFVGFGNPTRGREEVAIELFNETIGYYSRLQEEGEIENFEPVFLEPHGGDLGGFILIRGDAEKLSALRVSDEFIQFTIRASLCVDSIGVVAADMGERLQSQMAYYTEQIGAIA